MGIFSKLAQGLKKTKEAIAKKFYSLFTGRALDDEFYEDLENVLISSDVGVEATEQILERFKDECFERRISKADDAKELLRQIMVESIDYEIAPYEYPLIILVAGVNGVGKTTAIGKLAKFFKSRGKSVVMAAADTFRAAAGEQLEVWSQRAGVRLIKHEEGSDPAAVVFDALSSAKAKGTDVVLIDTAGRLQNKKNLMNELAKINKVVERECPDADYRTYIVLDATTGQNALSQVQEFDEIIDIDGIILNKMDGTAKGGVVFAISAERELPVVFVGVGEKIDDLAEFDAKTFIDSIFE
ncbi:MAG TPA: signal recognition particle-docking protein FtsY [Candidatus Caccalectryoclostridium excrementigallinarum]|uniref:Signal recognition particle receptor FtsY n=1 Tax=Candidatus Caccalectryoclostridium excrementigallinarum TaxID=2840710 RepID=A0A9D1MMW3_9FIRM|nr:signal recognition particle-docking protein FtsY [Candidatus Caccalectryoclostridium excrementigallinarum]